MVAVDYEARKKTNGSMKSLQAVSHADWLVATILWADPNTPTTILGIKVIIFWGRGKGEEDLTPSHGKAYSSVGDICRQQAGITCLTEDGPLIIQAIGAVKKSDFF